MKYSSLNEDKTLNLEWKVYNPNLSDINDYINKSINDDSLIIYKILRRFNFDPILSSLSKLDLMITYKLIKK